jgi:hypothetical protein
VLCSSGDFYGTADEFNEPKSHFVARMMAYLGYDAIGVGEMDLNYGVTTLLADADSLGLNVTCANLVAKGAMAARIQGEAAGTPRARYGTVFPPWLVVERDGVRVGFVALLSPATKVRDAMGDVEAINYIIRDPREVAEEAIPEAAGQCDVLVLLAHMTRSELDALLPDFPEVAIAVLGHESRTGAIGTPEEVGSSYVVKATSQGQNIGNLRVTLGDDNTVAEVHNEIHFLNERYDDDPEMVKLLDQFDVENRKIQKVLFAKSQLRSSGNHQSANRYLGVGTCQSCHAKEFEVYKSTRHAHAYATLAEQFVHRDTNCVGCHVTGWQDEGGFTGVRYRGDKVDLVDVQCEACHGPGALHNRDGSYLALAAESCVRCHTENDDPDFDFDTDWPKIAH